MVCAVVPVNPSPHTVPHCPQGEVSVAEGFEPMGAQASHLLLVEDLELAPVARAVDEAHSRVVGFADGSS